MLDLFMLQISARKGISFYLHQKIVQVYIIRMVYSCYHRIWNDLLLYCTLVKRIIACFELICIVQSDYGVPR